MNVTKPIDLKNFPLPWRREGQHVYADNGNPVAVLASQDETEWDEVGEMIVATANAYKQIHDEIVPMIVATKRGIGAADQVLREADIWQETTLKRDSDLKLSEAVQTWQKEKREQCRVHTN